MLLACIYPVWETLFSMWRKNFYRKTGMGKPDKVHFHMLVFRRLIGQKFGRKSPAWVRHGATSGYIWVMVVCCQIFAVSLSREIDALPAIMIAIYAFTYVAMYRGLLVRNRASATPLMEKVAQT